MTTKIEPVPVSAESGAGRGASLPLLLTIILLRAEHKILGRRGYSVVGGKGASEVGPAQDLALAGACLCLFVLLNPVFLPYGALSMPLFEGGDADRIAAEFHLSQFEFVFFELSATKVAMKNTLILGLRPRPSARSSRSSSAM